MTDVQVPKYFFNLPATSRDSVVAKLGVIEAGVKPFNGYHGAAGFPHVSMPAGIVLVLYAATFTGTGAIWTVTHTGYSAPGSSFPTISFVERIRKSAHLSLPPTHQWMLTRVRHAFRLNMTDLAGVFHVSRTAAYDWFKGAAPRAEQMERLIKFNEYAALVESKNIHRIDLLAKVPLSQGRTLIQTLGTGESIEQAINEIEQLSSLRSNAMERRQKLAAGKEKIYGVDYTTPSFSAFE